MRTGAASACFCGRRRPLLGRELSGQLAQFLVAGALVDRFDVRHLGAGPKLAAAVLVGRHVAGDRQHPGAQIVPVAELGIGPERAEERLLKGVLRALSAEPLHEHPEDDAAMLLVEALERWHLHDPHHRYKRTRTS